MNQHELLEAIEACRPGSQDVCSPEMAELAAAIARDPALQQRYERTQRWDAAMARALEDVPEPAGLADRLLAACAGASAADSGPQLPAGSEVAARSSPSTMTASRRQGRRRWVVRAVQGLSAVAALLALALVLRPLTIPVPHPTADFADEVIGWAAEGAASAWSSDFAAAQLADVRWDNSLQVRPRQWSVRSTRYHARTVVYDLTLPGRKPAYVFCFPATRKAADVPATPPLTPFSTTGGYSIGVWQRDGMVYVLAVQGGDRYYRSFLEARVILG